MTARILIVDDEPAHRRMLETVLQAENYETRSAPEGKSAIEAVEARFFDLILMDIRMNRVGGIEALQKIKELSPELPVIMMTAYASVDTAVQAMKAGAYDYLTKPLDTDELKIMVAKALRYRQLEQENTLLKERLASRFDFSNIIGRSRPMSRLLETVAMVAPSGATVLILGESGTGKELVANAIHQNSPRSSRPFIKVNCAALPENLLQSELFGHEKGAFSGAVKRRRGRFELAHQGSIFLDEIAEMSPATQSKILRVLQEREFEPIGSSEPIRVDTRIITATNRNLEAEVKAGRFREDLYYRINVVSLTVPPLRERREDIPLLADFFMQRFAGRNHRRLKGFTPKAMDLLMRYDWPGNIRELENAVERAVIMMRGDYLTPAEFPQALKNLDPEPDVPSGESEPEPGRSLMDMEKSMIARTLQETGGNRTHTAEILGISRRTLQLKLKKYGLQ